MKTTRTHDEAVQLAATEIEDLKKTISAMLPDDVGFVLGLAVPSADGQVYMRFQTNLSHKSAFEVMMAGGDAVLDMDNKIKGLKS